MSQEFDKYRLVTFADGDKNWGRSYRRFARQAHASGYFSTIQKYDYSRLNNILDTLPRNVRQFITSNSRGYGYWVWKPIILLDSLENLQDGEHGVIYLDVGCTINSNPIASSRMRDYMKIANTHSGLFFELRGNNKCADWVKRDAQIYMGLSPDVLGENLIVGGIFFLKNTEPNKALLKEWLRIMCEDNFHYLDDSPSVEPNSSNFVEHRHDQALLTGLIRKRTYPVIPDETYFSGNWGPDAFGFPILATRLRSGISKVSSSLFWKVVRKSERGLVKLRVLK